MYLARCIITSFLHIVKYLSIFLTLTVCNPLSSLCDALTLNWYYISIWSTEKRGCNAR